MKVLIVDDEEDVRDSIRLLVDWSAFGVDALLEASDGASAMRLIRSERPEIVFTDMMMPNVDGMELLQWIETEAPTAKTIVISGYDDYAYVRKTMKHGGLDYLLKPINPGELNEALRGAVNAWREDEEERRLDSKKNAEIHQTRQVYWDKVLSNVVAQPGFYRTVGGELYEDFGWTTVRSCQVAMLLTDPLPRNVQLKFGKNLDLLYFLLTNICNEIIGSRDRGYAFKHLDPNYGIVLLFAGDRGELERKLNAMNDAFDRILGARFYFACGPKEPFPEGVAASFEKAVSAAKSISFLSGSGWIFRYADAPPTVEKRVLLADYGDRIAVAVYSGDMRRIEAALGLWMEAVRRLDAVTWDHLKYWRYEFELLRNRLLETPDGSGSLSGSGGAGGGPPQGLFPIDGNGRIDLEAWQREWTEEFRRIADVLKQKQHKEKEHPVIHRVKQYVDANYRENITLQDVAGRFFISREYVSRRFKQEFGLNLFEYLERVRIENAKALLTNEAYAIGDIANMVGYPDGRYFSKIFRKLTGMTPREYRKTSGG